MAIVIHIDVVLAWRRLSRIRAVVASRRGAESAEKQAANQHGNVCGYRREPTTESVVWMNSR
jgi:hypothetical protein